MTLTKALLWVVPLSLLLTGSAGEAGGPRYRDDGALIMPADYRDWIFLSSGLDMSYSKAAEMAGHSMFDNVFVERAAWQGFKATGHWPDRTMLVMEVRGANTKGSINEHGHYQTDERMGIEIHVHDEARFKGGWAFFLTDGSSPAQQVPYAAECYNCHLKHGAVDTTFVQFYPTAKAIATKAGTYRAE